MSVTEITSAAAFQALLKSNTFVVVDFYADWCGPCHAIRPMFEKFAANHANPRHLAFAKVNVDRVADVAAQHSVTAMPTFLFFREGQPFPGTPFVRGADVPKLTRAVETVASLARDASAAEILAKRKESEQQKAATGSPAAASDDKPAEEAAQEEQKTGDDGSGTISGGYTLGKDAGGRSDWKMSLSG